jgi:prevent-host-death family protein
MIMVNINEAKTKLSEFLDAVGRGERVMICKRNRPVAELRAVDSRAAITRRLGTAIGKVTVSPSFLAPLPDDVLDAFEGSESRSLGTRVAEAKAEHRAGKPRRKS